MEDLLKSFAETGIVEDAPKKSPKPQYDPSKKYGWQPDSTFCFSGEEYGVLINSLRAILNTPEGKLLMLAQRANMAVENALSRAVERSEAHELPEEIKAPKK